MLDLFVIVLTGFMSWWYETELFLAVGGVFVMLRFFFKWYRPLLSAWPPERGKNGRILLSCLPVVTFAIVLFTLLTMASYDVQGFWVLFYLILGYAWVYGGMSLMGIYLDLPGTYDTVYLDNRAAVFPTAGGLIGVTLIYAGANIGDGPGWWVILISGGLGVCTWLGLAMLVNRFAQVSERITVDRDRGCGVRFGAYLLASGLILARASGGDWTSFHVTLLEFLAGWPVLPLTLFVILFERFLLQNAQPEFQRAGVRSMLSGCLYLVYAVIALLLQPSVGTGLLYGMMVVI